MVDPYHPRYPDTTRDYMPRLMWLARLLLVAQQHGIKDILWMNREHRERLEALAGPPPQFDTIRL